MSVERAPLAHPPRLRLTVCQGCGLPLPDDTAHPTAIQCRASLLARLAEVEAERDALLDDCARLQALRVHYRAQLTATRSTLALVRSQVGMLGQTVGDGKDAG